MKKLTSMMMVVGLLLSGCAKAPAPTVPLASQPTLPSFSEALTPLQQLEQAQELTRKAGAFRITFPDGVQQVVQTDYGYHSLLEAEDYRLRYDETGCYRMDLTVEAPQWELQPQQPPYTAEQVFSQVRQQIPNERLLEDFCESRLIVTPSNDGSFTFHQTELTLDRLYTLIHGVQPSQTLPEGVGNASITVDPDGYLAGVKFEARLSDGSVHTLEVTIDQIGE